LTNRRKAKWQVIIVLIFLSASLSAAVYTLSVHSPPAPSMSASKTLAPHQRIVVTEDGEFTAPGTGTGCECVREGYGNSSHPFVISGWELSASDGDGISIAWTTAHFIILNVRVNGTGRYGGVVLTAVENGKILNSSLSGCSSAIYVWKSSHIIIANNTVSHSEFGIMLEASNNNGVIGNKSHNNHQVGIFVRASDNVIDGNLVSDGSFGGINVDGTAGFGGDNQITNNVVRQNLQYGIGLWHALANHISGNAVSGNGGAGIMLTDSSANNSIENNQVTNNGADGILIAEQSSANRVVRNIVTGNGNAVTTFDLHDESLDNIWLDNVFNTRKPGTIN